ncbi:MAG: RNA polymerase factor sigma-54 [Spirochaetota bacterium]|jgi:RNA polymerase sigma-54 factor|nr:RNA polymerase factor sigma-54 [Spirochaetota bacterium]
MGLAVNINLEQKQKLVMTQTLREAIELLQMGSIELSERIEQELQENPMLEIREESSSVDSAAEGQGGQKLAADSDYGNGFEDSSDNGFEYSLQGRRNSDSKRQFLEGMAQRGQTLSEYLMEQLRLITQNEEDTRIGEIIISCLDENGYLRRSIAELSEEMPVCGRSAKDFARVLDLVQSLDPAGVAASDLSECLLLQLRDRDERDPIAEAIVRDHLGLLEKHAWRQIASKLGSTAERIEEASRLIAGLEPLPGRRFSIANTEYAIPDVIVRRQGDEFVIIVNDEWLPKLYISSTYRGLMQNKETGSDVKTYISDKLGSAQWLIRSLAQRHETLRAVTQALLEEQSPFFLHGPGHLRPLTLRQIADRIGIHESTVSRASSNKYMETPWGIYRLKYFFSGAITQNNGQLASAQSVREMIRRIIEEEDGKLSDQEIMGILQNRGIHIARRTVAKYRKMQRILSSNKRRSGL